MNALQVDRLNIALLLVSAAVAWFLPFGAFLLAYAVLGPLHYFTEIHWLHQRDYFVQNPSIWPWVLVGVAALLSVYPLMQLGGRGEGLGQWWAFRHPEFWVIWAVWMAAGMIRLKQAHSRLVWGVVGGVLSGLFVWVLPTVSVMLKVLIPTVVHVFLFTWLFMVWGQRKSGSVAGWLGVGMMGVIPVLLWLLPATTFPDAAQATYAQSNLMVTNLTLESLFGVEPGTWGNTSQRIQVFLAFAYTYHYLNWFSKTTIIGWGKELTRTSMAVMAVLWVASMGVYAWDYEMGLKVLFFVSFVHVVLELPLNARTVQSLLHSP